jgi:hypothetical protein
MNMKSGLILAAAAGGIAGVANAELDKTPIALEWQKYDGDVAGYVYINMNTGERIVNSEAVTGTVNRGAAWAWQTNVADPCEGAAGVAIEDQGIGVFTGINSDVNGDAQASSGVRLWQNWFDAPADTLVTGFTFQYYTGLQDPGFTPGVDPTGVDPAGIVGYDMILAFTETDDPANQSTAIAHSPVIVTELFGANDTDSTGDIEFAEGFLWTVFLDFADTPIEIADSDGSSAGHPQGADTDAPGTVGEGQSDCGFVVTFRQPGVDEGDDMFTNNPLIDFSGIAGDVANTPSGAPDLATFPNIEPTGTGLFAPSNRLDTFAATAGAITQWPVDTAVVVQDNEGFGAFDAMEIFSSDGVDESDDGFLFFFGGFGCLTPGGGTDGYENPYSSFMLMLNIDGVGGGGGDGCNIADVAEDFGVLDLADINTFIAGFLANDPISDVAPAGGNGVWDLADINAFIAAFLAGCP